MMLIFFFKQKTAYEMRISDWSSDVCSSDLARHRRPRAPDRRAHCRQRHVARGGTAAACLRLCLPGAGALSLAHGGAQRHAAAGDIGPELVRAPRKGGALPRPGEPQGLREELSLAAFRRSEEQTSEPSSLM